MVKQIPGRVARVQVCCDASVDLGVSNLEFQISFSPTLENDLEVQLEVGLEKSTSSWPTNSQTSRNTLQIQENESADTFLCVLFVTLPPKTRDSRRHPPFTMSLESTGAAVSAEERKAERRFRVNARQVCQL